MADTMITPTGFACVNGVALQGADGPLNAEELRQRACSELLRQAAIAESLLDGTDAPPDDGVLSEAASEAIEALLEKCVVVPEPSEEACRRHHAAHRSFYSSGERVRARHILFAVTQGVDVSALRQRAEATLLDVRCHDPKAAEDAFAKAARAHRSSPASCSAMRRWACCRAWCTAALACTWSKSWSAIPVWSSLLRRCKAPWPWRCARRPT